MKLIIKMVTVALCSLLIFSQSTYAESPTHDNIAKQNTPQKYIVEYAKQYKIDSFELLKVAKCESRLNPLAEGDKKNGEYLAIGLYQYHKGTWNDFVSIYKREVYNEDLNRNSYLDQAKLTAFIFAKHPKLKTRWSTYVAYKKGGTYKFYSRLLKKNFVVVCK